MDRVALQSAVDGRDWYHTIDLGDGVVTPGWFDTRTAATRVPLPTSLQGRRCLDVGTFDGFWAFEMERRDAADVVAVDVLDPARWDWPVTSPDEVRRDVSSRHDGGGGFDIAREALGSGVRREDMTVYEIDEDRLGRFDFVYVGSLLIHLRDPVRALELVRSVCDGQLVLVDAIDAWTTMRFPRRAMAELDGRDRPWWWRANQAAIVRMVEAAGFRIDGEPQRFAMPPGVGQQRAPLRWSTVRNRGAREALIRTRIGDPHVALTATPM